MDRAAWCGKNEQCWKYPLSLFPLLLDIYIFLPRKCQDWRSHLSTSPAVLYSLVITSRSRTRKQECWVGRLRRLLGSKKVSLLSFFLPSCCLDLLDQQMILKMEAVLQSRSGEDAWSLMTVEQSPVIQQPWTSCFYSFVQKKLPPRLGPHY